jgi:hypothetical protein
MLARFGFELGDGWRQPARNTLFRLIPACPAVKAGAPHDTLETAAE